MEPPPQDLPARFHRLINELRGDTLSSLELDVQDDRELHQHASRNADALAEAFYANQWLKTIRIDLDMLSSMKTSLRKSFLQAMWRKQHLSTLCIGRVNNVCARLLLSELADTIPTLEHTTDVGARLRFLSIEGLFVESMDEVHRFVQALRAWGRVKELWRIRFAFLGVHETGAAAALETNQGILDPLLEFMGEVADSTKFQFIALCPLENDPAKVTYERSTIPLIGPVAAERFISSFSGSTFSGKSSSVVLNSLGLNDAIVHKITSTLQTRQHHLREIHLGQNPALTRRSLEYWMTAIDQSENLTSVILGKDDWDATLKLHVKLNEFGRRQAVQDGLYQDQAVWVAWLAKLARVERLAQKFYFQKYSRDNDALTLTSLYLSVRGQPNFIR